MTEPIRPLSQPAPQQSPNIPVLSRQMQAQVMTLADHLQKVMADPSLATESGFLNEFASNASHLNHTVDQAILVG